MRTLVRRWGWMSGLAAVGVGLAAAGIAYASIPDSNGLIHGCYNPNGAKATNGTGLNIIDSASASCGKSMQPVTWNQTGTNGPTGAAGPTGATGPAGPTGAAGASTAYTNYNRNILIQDVDTVTVASVTLPPGSYTLTGTVRATNDGTDSSGTAIVCTYVTGGSLDAVPGAADFQDDNQYETFPMNGDVTTSTAQTPVFLRCLALGSDMHVDGTLIATKVAALTPSE